MVTILFISVIVLAIFLTSAIMYIDKLQKQINLLDKEQHVQNEDIYKVMKENYEIKGMLLQHIDILKYLVEQDPILGKKVMYTGPIGEA